MIEANGIGIVRSGTHTYEIDETDGCTCQDAQHRSKWCKHAVAVELHKRSQLRLGGNGIHTNGHHPQSLAPAPETTSTRVDWTFQDPPFVHTMKWTDGLGIEHMHVIRACNMQEVTQQVGVMSALIKASREQAPAPEPPAARPKRQVRPCPVCAGQKLFQNNNGIWSHRRDDGSYCQGK